MTEMGHSKFSFRPVFINSATSSKTIQAQGQYWYLISEAVPNNCVIESDTNLFSDAANFGTFNFNYLQEFSGQIKIETTDATFQLEFIKVIPED